MKRKFLTAALVGALITIPMQSALSDAPPPEDDFWLAACIVAVAGLAVTAVYIVSKKCEPKYYWLMDGDNPPNFWVGTATRKECEVQGWHRIGGPYTKPSDAPVQHPASTNRVENIVGPVVNIGVESLSGTNWTTVYQTQSELEDFIYWPTNQGLFRLVERVP